MAEVELEQLVDRAAKISGVEGKVDIEFYNANDGTMGAHKNGKIYINLAYQDGNATTLMTVLGDEMSHYVDYKKGKSYDPKRQSISTFYGNETERQAMAYLGDKTATVQEMLDFQSNVSKLDLSKNNAEVAGIPGLEKRTFYVHGTDSDPTVATPEFLESLRKTYGDVDNVITIKWNAYNNNDARIIGGKEMYDQVQKELLKNPLKPGEKLNIVAHSHGGNVVKEFTQLYSGDKKIDNIVFLGTPHLSNHKLDWNKTSSTAQLLNVYDMKDPVQPIGIGFNRSWPIDFTLPSRTLDGLTDLVLEQKVKVDFPRVHAGTNYRVRVSIANTHSAYYTKEVWDEQISPKLVQNRKLR